MNNRGAAAGAGIGGFLLGMLAGAVVAGVATLLLAPKSGSDTRAIIMGKAAETREKLKSQIGSVREKLGSSSSEQM